MTRKEIANEAFKILSRDFAGEYKDKSAVESNSRNKRLGVA